MLETLKDIVIALTFALACYLAGYVLKLKKQQILAITQELIQKAEKSVNGSGMGVEKKALVVAQLEAMGIKANTWLDKEIDNIVSWLNEKGAWYADSAGDAAANTVQG